MKNFRAFQGGVRGKTAVRFLVIRQRKGVAAVVCSRWQDGDATVKPDDGRYKGGPRSNSGSVKTLFELSNLSHDELLGHAFQVATTLPADHEARVAIQVLHGRMLGALARHASTMLFLGHHRGREDAAATFPHVAWWPQEYREFGEMVLIP